MLYNIELSYINNICFSIYPYNYVLVHISILIIKYIKNNVTLFHYLRLLGMLLFIEGLSIF